MLSMVKRLLTATFAAVILLVPGRALFADTFTYTFSGVGSGTISGNTNTSFSDKSFSVTLVENTSTLGSFGPGSGFFLYSGVSGTFTEGSYSATFTGVTLEVNGNPDSGMGAFETVFLFNGDFGSSIGINSNPALLNYALSTPITVTGVSPNFGAFQDAAGFATSGGDKVEFTGLDSLTFTAADNTTPEPSTLVLLATGLSGIGAMVRRRLVA